MSLSRPVWRSDYANARQLSALETFSRGSTATRTNKLGALTAVATHQPRFDFNPETLACRGVLIEPAATNLCTQSEFANGVTDAPTRGGLVSAASMSGFAGALSFGYDGATLTTAYKSYTPVASTTYTLSAFVEMADGLAPTFAGGTTGAASDFALVGADSVFAPDGVAALGQGRYRVSRTYTTPSSGANANHGVIKYASNSNRTFKVSGWQLEVGSAPTSYIPTAAAAATRAADFLSITGPDFSRLWRADEGTIVSRMVLPAYRPALSEFLLSLNTGATTNRLGIYRQAGNGVIVANITLAGTSVFSVGLGAGASAGTYTVALSWQAGQYRAALNGSALAVSASTSLPVASRLDIGHLIGGNNVIGAVGFVEVHARASTLDELAEITR